MFTIDQIKAAHSKVKSGADFPKYIQELRGLGVRRYVNYVVDGHTEYNDSVWSEAKYEKKNIADTGNKEKLEAALKLHQSGGSSYATFCSQAAESGVCTWVVDIEAMTCTYVDVNNIEMIVEEIPS